MRLDLCLKHSGLVKRRTVAKYLCERGLASINNKVGKPSSNVNDNDVVTLILGEKVVTFRVNLKQEGRKIYVTYTLINEGKIGEGDA